MSNAPVHSSPAPCGLTRKILFLLFIWLCLWASPGAFAQRFAQDSGGDVRVRNDVYPIEQDKTLEVAAPGVLANDTGIEGAEMMALMNTDVTHGQLDLKRDGSFVFVPPAGYSGFVKFSYQAKCGDKVSPVATVTIAVLKSKSQIKTLASREKLDLSIYMLSGSAPVEPGEGLGINNSDAANQMVGYALTRGQKKDGEQDEQPKFLLQLFNLSGQANSFRINGAVACAGWSLHYFDAFTGGNEITADVGSDHGWATPSIQSGKSLEIRLEVTLDPKVKDAAAGSALITATSAADEKATDTVKATFGFQRIAKLQYSPDQGATWIDAPTPESGGSIPGDAHSIFGVRAVRFDPTLPWPFAPDIKPMWMFQKYWMMGEAVWVECPAPSTELVSIEAECGNTVVANFKTAESYHVSLSASQTYIPLNGGEKGQVRLSAKVTNSSQKPVAGATVRFTATFDDLDDAPAGELVGSGPKRDLAVTDADGIAVIVLKTGATGGSVTIGAILNQEGHDVQRAREQAVVFGLIETEVAEPDSELFGLPK